MPNTMIIKPNINFPDLRLSFEKSMMPHYLYKDKPQQTPVKGVLGEQPEIVGEGQETVGKWSGGYYWSRFGV